MSEPVECSIYVFGVKCRQPAKEMFNFIEDRSVYVCVEHYSDLDWYYFDQELVDE